MATTKENLSLKSRFQACVEKFQSRLVPYVIPYLNFKVWIRSITVAERAKLLKDDASKAPALMIIAGVMDEDGKPVFTVADIPAIEAFPYGVCDSLTSQISKVSGMTLEFIEDAEKN